MRWVFVLLVTAGLVRAEGEPAGVFDYYVLSLSWSPGWCETEGAARNSPQCARGLGFVLHGLWPQYRRGYPSWCHSPESDPSRDDTEAMADLMGTDGAAWHQWKKHGRCTGLTSDEYFALARRAIARVTLPPVFERIDRDIELPASLIEEGFLAANPSLTADMVTITCKGERIQEVRVCLTKDLQPRDCGFGVSEDCRLEDALLDGR